jgi:hypothetical protein
MRGKTQPAQESLPATPAQQPMRWCRTFPYHWDADDFVARRQLLQWAVLTSRALFAGTAILAVLGRLAGPPPRRLPRIVLRREGDTLIALAEVP